MSNSSIRCILLTGATGKFGRVLARHLLKEGHIVVGTSRTQQSLDALRDMYAGEGLNVNHWVGIPVDFEHANAITSLIEDVDRKALRIDCLINNARSLEYLKTQSDGIVSRHNFTREYVIDVVVPYELSMAFASQENAGLQQIINIGSQYGTVAANLTLYEQPLIQSPIHYSVAKAALAHLTKELGTRLASRDIQVNCIAYGGVAGRVDEAFKVRFSQLSPIGRMLTDDEIVAPVQMLINNPALSMTGHVLHADGGWSLW